MSLSDDIQAVSPALKHYTDQTLVANLWHRQQLSSRDRSVITLTTLIARQQSIELDYHLGFALDNGVTPIEISEIIAHLAFYSGWANGTLAASIANGVFVSRGITAADVSDDNATPLPIDKVAEQKRSTVVNESLGSTFQGLIDFTGDILFKDLWLRPALAARDRSLVTVSALVAAGQVAQIPFHLNRAMDNGLTEAQAAEVITHLAFYAGWPNAMSAVPVAKGVFEKRPS